MNKVQSDVLATHGAWNDMYVTQVPVPTATMTNNVAVTFILIYNYLIVS